jgi:hypothetical protein
MNPEDRGKASMHQQNSRAISGVPRESSPGSQTYHVNFSSTGRRGSKPRIYAFHWRNALNALNDKHNLAKLLPWTPNAPDAA